MSIALSVCFGVLATRAKLPILIDKISLTGFLCNRLLKKRVLSFSKSRIGSLGVPGATALLDLEIHEPLGDVPEELADDIVLRALFN
jgi:hypothetical protein